MWVEFSILYPLVSEICYFYFTLKFLKFWLHIPLWNLVGCPSILWNSVECPRVIEICSSYPLLFLLSLLSFSVPFFFFLFFFRVILFLPCSSFPLPFLCFLVSVFFLFCRRPSDLVVRRPMFGHHAPLHPSAVSSPPCPEWSRCCNMISGTTSGAQASIVIFSLLLLFLLILLLILPILQQLMKNLYPNQSSAMQGLWWSFYLPCP